MGGGGCGRQDPSPTPQRALLRAGFARCGGGPKAPGGGRLLPGCGASGVGRSPTPDRPSFGACGPLPTGCGSGGCGHGDRSPTPQRALLRAGIARCGGGTRAPGGGASCLGVRRLGSGALSPQAARPLWHAAGAQYPLAVGAGGVGVGTRYQPQSLRYCELALRIVGAARGRPGGGGASCLCVERPGSGALAPPTARPLGRAAGAHYPLAVGAGGAGVGTRHQPHSARSCELALRAVGAAQGRPGGGPLLPGCGASRVGRSPTPDRPSFGACSRGPLPSGRGCRGSGRGDPSPTPQRAPLRAGFAPCGGGTRAPGGGAPLAWVWGVRGRALSHPRPPVL